MSWLSCVLLPIPNVGGAIGMSIYAAGTAGDPFDAWMRDPRPWTFGEFLLWLDTGRAP